MTAAPAPTAVNPRLVEEILGVATDIAGVLGPGADADVAIPGALWSVGEAAAHLALANELMADLALGRPRGYGDGTPGGLAEANEQSLAVYRERDPAVLAEAIVRHARTFAEAAARGAAAGPLDSPLGPIGLDVLASYLLTHMLGHGYDLARALGRPHMLNAERVELSLPFLMTAMPRVLDQDAARGRRVRYVIGLRGGPRFAVAIADGAVTVGPDLPGRPDCTIVCEPVGFLLMALGRRGPWATMARGGVVARGRRPWLAPGFTKYFPAP
ncbi:maleylpyruvate isomerase family mycothiol-dependent enzyme [Streptacidiphilus sp. 4-A2]|nr:maleylpyruvate isomerase family mycothiol-dependent enzyme [Streptacidiphilus sp. 4-A2]